MLQTETIHDLKQFVALRYDTSNCQLRFPKSFQAFFASFDLKVPSKHHL